MDPDYTHPDSFKTNGFVVIPEVLAAHEVQALRDTIYRTISAAPLEKRSLTIGDLLKNEALLRALIAIQFSGKLLAKLRAIIPGDICYVNNLNLQCNMFGLGGWHTDCGSEVDSRNHYLYEPGYLFGKVGVYLQDNTRELGGGINLIRRSHRAFKQLRFARGLSYLYSGLRSKAVLASLKLHGSGDYFVPIKAGSALYFDSRLLHRSSPPESLTLDENERQARRLADGRLGEAGAKYVLYWEACAKQYSDGFLMNSARRAVAEEVGLRRSPARESFFSEYLSYHYPSDYPQSYVAGCAGSERLSIASLDEQVAGFWKSASRL